MRFQVELWDAINRYAVSCGGDPGSHVYGNTLRMQAVVEVNQVVARATHSPVEVDAAEASEGAPAPGPSWHDFMSGRTDATPLDAALRDMAAPSTRCPECGRPRSLPKLPVPAAGTYCGECHAPFTLDEISKLFQEANLLDSNSARQVRRTLVEDLVEASRGVNTALKTLQADHEHLLRLYAESRDYVRALERERDDLVDAANRGVVEQDRLDAEVEQLREQLRGAEAVRDDARGASARDLGARRALDAEVRRLRIERDQLLAQLASFRRGES